MLEDFVGVSLAKDAKVHNHARLRDPPRTATLELPPEGLVFPLKAEYDRKNDTLEGLTETHLEREGGLFDLPPDAEAAPPREPGGSDRWLSVGDQRIRVHSTPRKRLFDPNGVDGGPNISELHPTRTTHLYFVNGVVRTIKDEWVAPEAEMSQGVAWTGLTIFTKGAIKPDVPGDKGVEPPEPHGAKSFDPPLIDRD